LAESALTRDDDTQTHSQRTDHQKALPSIHSKEGRRTKASVLSYIESNQGKAHCL